MKMRTATWACSRWISPRHLWHSCRNHQLARTGSHMPAAPASNPVGPTCICSSSSFSDRVNNLLHDPRRHATASTAPGQELFYAPPGRSTPKVECPTLQA